MSLLKGLSVLNNNMHSLCKKSIGQTFAFLTAIAPNSSIDRKTQIEQICMFISIGKGIIKSFIM